MAWKLAEHIAFRKRHFGGFLIDIRDNSKQFLNNTAADVAQLCDGTKGTQEIAALCAERWGAPAEKVSEDVKALIKQMSEIDYVEYVPNGGLPVVGAPGSPSGLQVTGSEGPMVLPEDVPPLQHAQVHLSKACSLRCNHCYNSSGEPMPWELSKEELFRFFDQLKELKAYQVTLTGGEPMFHPNFWEILEYVRERFTVIMLTNGIHLSEENCRRLAEAKLYEICISLDGTRPETNDPLRGKNTFKHIVRGIEQAVAHELPVTMNMAVTGKNMDELDDMVELARSLGVKKVTATPLVATGRAEKSSELFLDSDAISEFKMWCFRKNQEYPDMLIGELDPGGEPPQKVRQHSSKPRKSNLCNAIRGSVTLLPNGDIIPCTLMEKPELVTGNVREKTLAEIWGFAPLHKTLRTLSTGNCEVCQDCEIKDLCGGACRAITYIENGSFTGPPATEECAWRQQVFERFAGEVGTDTSGLIEMLGLGS